MKSENIDEGFLWTFLFCLCVFWVCFNYFSCNKFWIVSRTGSWLEMPSFHKLAFKYQTGDSKKAACSIWWLFIGQQCLPSCWTLQWTMATCTMPHESREICLQCLPSCSGEVDTQQGTSPQQCPSTGRSTNTSWSWKSCHQTCLFSCL